MSLPPDAPVQMSSAPPARSYKYYDLVLGAFVCVLLCSNLIGVRKITHVTEIIGMEGDVVTLQDLFVYEIQGEDASGRIVGRHKFTGLRPAFWDQAKYFGRERDLAEIMGEDVD